MSGPFGATPDPSGVPLNPRTAVLRCTLGPRAGEIVGLEAMNLVFGRSSPVLAPVDVDLASYETSSPGVTSRRHAELSWESGRLVVRDLGSSNGTYVNDARLEPVGAERISEPHPLGRGDRLRFANVEFEIIEE